jgi:hypothetical protein
MQVTHGRPVAVVPPPPPPSPRWLRCSAPHRPHPLRLEQPDRCLLLISTSSLRSLQFPPVPLPYHLRHGPASPSPPPHPQPRRCCRVTGASPGDALAASGLAWLPFWGFGVLELAPGVLPSACWRPLRVRAALLLPCPSAGVFWACPTRCLECGELFQSPRLLKLGCRRTALLPHLPAASPAAAASPPAASPLTASPCHSPACQRTRSCCHSALPRQPAKHTPFSPCPLPPLNYSTHPLAHPFGLGGSLRAQTTPRRQTQVPLAALPVCAACTACPACLRRAQHIVCKLLFRSPFPPPPSLPARAPG